MDFREPMHVVTPTLDGDVLRALAGADVGMTARDVQQLVVRGSKPGIRLALQRLVAQGVVLQDQASQTYVYRLNRSHIAAPWIEGLAGIRGELLDRIRDAIDDWTVKPTAALLFGSAARGEAGPDSDLDLLFVRPAKREPDSSPWAEQLTHLAQETGAWSGNDARPLEYGEEELPGLAGHERVLDDVLRDGIDLTPGAGATLKRLMRHEI
jgi:hypothetical protein